MAILRTPRQPVTNLPVRFAVRNWKAFLYAVASKPNGIEDSVPVRRRCNVGWAIPESRTARQKFSCTSKTPRPTAQPFSSCTINRVNGSHRSILSQHRQDVWAGFDSTLLLPVYSRQRPSRCRSPALPIPCRHRGCCQSRRMDLERPSPLARPPI